MASWLQHNPPEISSVPEHPAQQILRGDWTFQHANALLELLSKTPISSNHLDARHIQRLDASGGKILLSHLQRANIALQEVSMKPEHLALMRAVELNDKPVIGIAAPVGTITHLLALLGEAVIHAKQNIILILAFLGQIVQSFLSSLFSIKRWRTTSTVFHMQAVGLNAVPLVMLLSFMVGAVVAFLGATVLREFGAELYVVELVGVAFMREFGIILTAILLAGRTASAFTAQIGSMKSGEELDAIKTMGLDSIELLVLPRIKALMITLPLLSFLATMAGLFGGMMVCKWNLDIAPEMFLSRLNSELSPRHFWVGLCKAPLFALIIGLIGCLEGFKVQNNAQSVGEHTTSSVVQSISWIIILDALAALFFMEMDW